MGSAWSPDGACIASCRSGDIFCLGVDPSTGLPAGAPSLLVGGPSSELSPTFSPDGQWLAFASNRAGNYDIYKVRKDGTGLTRLTNSSVNAVLPVWSAR